MGAGRLNPACLACCCRVCATAAAPFAHVSYFVANLCSLVLQEEVERELRARQALEQKLAAQQRRLEQAQQQQQQQQQQQADGSNGG